jgi:hypothetical protein
LKIGAIANAGLTNSLIQLGKKKHGLRRPLRVVLKTICDPAGAGLNNQTQNKQEIEMDCFNRHLKAFMLQWDHSGGSAILGTS